MGQMIANEGKLNGNQIIPAEWMERGRSGDAAAFKEYTGLLPKGAYSAQFWVTDNDRRITSVLGYGGQQIDIDINLVIVKPSTWDTPNYAYATDTYQVFAATSDHFRLKSNRNRGQ